MGREKAEDLLKWCKEHSEGGPRIISNKTNDPIEGTEGRGLQQLAGDLINIAVNRLSGDELQVVVDRINRRVLKGLRRKFRDDLSGLERINKDFAGTQEPAKTLASVPAGSVLELWVYLT